MICIISYSNTSLIDISLSLNLFTQRIFSFKSLSTTIPAPFDHYGATLIAEYALAWPHNFIFSEFMFGLSQKFYVGCQPA